MANTLVRSLGGPGPSGSPLVKRGSHILSDGSLLSIVADANKSGVSGAAGDGTNDGKLYAYRSTDGGATWVLKVTVDTFCNTTSYIECSTAVDSSDNIYFTYITPGGTVVWQKATNASYTYSLSSAFNIFAATTSTTAIRVDVDTFANGYTVTGVFTHQITGAAGTGLVVVIVDTTGNVIYTKSIPLLSGVTTNAGWESVTVSATHDAIVGNLGSWVAVATRQPASGTDYGDLLAYGCVNLATHAEIQYYSAVTLAMAGKLARNYQLFCVDGARDFVLAVMSAGSGAVYGYKRFNLSAAGSTQTANYETALLTSVISGTNPDTTGNYYVSTSQYVDNVSGLLVFAYSANANTDVYTVSVNIFTNSFRNNSLGIEQGVTIIGNALACVSGGNNRNFTAGKIAFLAHYPRSGYQARNLIPPLPTAPTNVIPAAGAIVQTALPDLGLDYKEPYSSPGGAVQAYYKTASDSGFTSNVKTYLSPVVVLPFNTDPVNNAKISDTYHQTSLMNELASGTWFIQGFAFDEYGRFSPGSTVTSFTVSHPPSAINLNPNGGQVINYGAGSVSFSWQFTDAYINDSQTAFQLQIVDASNNPVYDSGVVTSTAHSAAVAIAAGYKDVALFWRIALSNRDGVQGAFSSNQAFKVSDAPVITVTAPTAGQVITGGTPTVSWTNGIASPKTQAAFSVNVYDVASGTQLYSLVGTTATSLVIPTGVLHNNKSYEIIISVTDSNGLSSIAAPTYFTTMWTPPAAADVVRAYLARYATNGYVFIGWSNLNIDSRFLNWNLYRRALGDSSWKLIQSVSSIKSSYGYRDYDVKSGVVYQYAVTQVVNQSGDLIEANLNVQAAVTIPASSYWLIDPLGIAPSVPIYQVTADTYTDEQETAVYTVIGAGRHVDEGDVLGKSGSLTIELWDKANGLLPSVNSFLNPSFQAAAQVNQPDNWTIGGVGSFGTVSSDYVTFYETAPNNQLINLVIRSTALGNALADAITFTQNITSDRLPVPAGQSFDHSEWLAAEVVAGNSSSSPIMKSVVQYFNASSVLISTETINASAVDTYEPASSGDLNTGSWTRFVARHTIPAGTDHMTVSSQVKIAVAGSYGVITGGAQLEPSITPYFDGDVRGASWLNGQYISSSYTNGYYLARQQQIDIRGMRNLGRPLYLKTPFGQSLYVKLGTGGSGSSGASGPSFARLAGTTAEFGTLTLTYIEVVY